MLAGTLSNTINDYVIQKDQSNIAYHLESIYQHQAPGSSFLWHFSISFKIIH